MTTEQAYEKFLLKSESNISNNNITTDRGRFVLLFNEAQNKFVELTLEKRNEDDILQIRKLLVPNRELTDVFENTTSINNFTLPDNYLSPISVFATASKVDGCQGVMMSLFQIKPENASEILQDDSNKPSFTYRESPYYYSEKGVTVFVDGFTITKLNLTYYRQPLQIALADENNPEGGFSADNPELSDEIVDRIISIATAESDLNTNNNRFQAQRQRAISEV